MNYCLLRRFSLALLLCFGAGCSSSSDQSSTNGNGDSTNQTESGVEGDVGTDSNSRDNSSPSQKSSTEALEEPAKEFTDPFQTRILSWNVESEGSNPVVIAKQLGEFDAYDIVALCEVLPQSVNLYKKALGDDFESVHSKTGNNDRLQLLFNNKRFELMNKFELDDINSDNNRHRSPLVIQLKDRQNSQEFLVMNNHLARGDAKFRTVQADRLVAWAKSQKLPVIAVGDYNFDFVFATEKGNDGFVAMQKDNVWKWIRPSKWIDTNWYDPEPDGVDNYPGSMLDFAYLANGATNWTATCNIIVRDSDFPDDKETSDHRPFELILSN